MPAGIVRLSAPTLPVPAGGKCVRSFSAAIPALAMIAIFP
jgi:hypothetical protein